MAARSEHRIFPHGKPEAVAPGLWRVVGSLAFPLKRNMFVYRLPDGGLVLHSVVAMDDAGHQALEALGRPAWMVVPHAMHTMDAQFYADRYPELKVASVEPARKRLPEVRFDATPQEALGSFGIGVHPIPGTKCGEVVLDLPLEDGRALVFTDLVGRNEGNPGLMLKLLGPPGGNGVSRIVKLRQVTDKAKVRDFLIGLADTPSLRIVAGSHGGVIADDCAAWLQAAAAGL